MHLCLITDRPAHPVIGAAIGDLRLRHRVRVIDPDAAHDVRSVLRLEMRDRADVYLLRSHSQTSVDFALHLERSGALVINAAGATAACRDRMAISEKARSAGLPWPETWAATDLEACAWLEVSRYPVVVKTRHSYRGDLVRKVTSREEMNALAAACRGERLIVQPYLASDGRDRKLYVVDRTVFGICCPSPLSSGDPAARLPISVPPAWAALARDVGRVFGLRVYGVDLLLSPAGPVIVDVNAFPGLRGVPGGAQALIDMINRTAIARGASP